MQKRRHEHFRQFLGNDAGRPVPMIPSGPMSAGQGGPSPVTALVDEERLLQASVREFAADEVAPRSHAMDAAGAMDAALIRRLFDLGLMGLTIPEALGGSEIGRAHV